MAENIFKKIENIIVPNSVMMRHYDSLSPEVKVGFLISVKKRKSARMKSEPDSDCSCDYNGGESSLCALCTTVLYNCSLDEINKEVRRLEV